MRDFSPFQFPHILWVLCFPRACPLLTFAEAFASRWALARVGEACASPLLLVLGVGFMLSFSSLGSLCLHPNLRIDLRSFFLVSVGSLESFSSVVGSIGRRVCVCVCECVYVSVCMCVSIDDINLSSDGWTLVLLGFQLSGALCCLHQLICSTRVGLHSGVSFIFWNVDLERARRMLELAAAPEMLWTQLWAKSHLCV